MAPPLRFGPLMEPKSLELPRLACSASFLVRCDGGYVHIQVVCGLVACVVWERRWGQSPRTMTASILPDAKPKRMRSQADLSGFWGQVGDRDYDVFVQEAQVHYSLANQF